MTPGFLAERPSPPSEFFNPEPEPATGPHVRARLEEAVQAVRETPSLLAGLVMLSFLAGISLSAGIEFGPHLTSYFVSRTAQRIADTPPSAAHPMGVLNYLGVDIFQGLYQATPLDLMLFGSILLGSAGIGLFAGTSAGLFGGGGEWLVTTSSDLISAVPSVFLVSVLFVGIGGFVPYPYLLPAFAALFILVLWPYYARPILARAREVAETGYVQAAQAAGAGRTRLMFRHGMPNSYVPILAQLPTDFVTVVFVLTMFPYLSCLSPTSTFLVTPLPNQTYPDWGFLLAYGVCSGWSPFPAANFWWMYTFPAAAIVFLGLAITLCCDGLERWTVRRFRR